MTKLLIYINPTKEFTEDYASLVKVQLDWDKDVKLVTNFPYSYNGVEAIVVPDDLYCEHRMRASKINVICHLLENGLDDICWFHDFDAFQLSTFDKDILKDKDAAFTDYGFNEGWNTGSFFFNKNSKNIFDLIRKTMNERKINEEQALNILTSKNKITNYLKLDNTYNYGLKRESEAKPVRVLHFHPKNGAEVYKKAISIMPESLTKLIQRDYPFNND